MTTEKAQSLGGQKSALIQRAAALEKYNSNPNICKQCGNTIQVKDTEKVRIVRKKLFCSKTCAAKYNNTRSPKRTKKLKECIDCGSLFSENRIRCSSCFEKYTTRLISKTKAEATYTNGEHSNKYSQINMHARALCKDRPQVCTKCGYDKHVQVHHIKSIRSFSEDTLVSEINDPNNLILLCPNCHWEVEHLS